MTPFPPSRIRNFCLWLLLLEELEMIDKLKSGLKASVTSGPNGFFSYKKGTKSFTLKSNK
jgi:hypothetical protein